MKKTCISCGKDLDACKFYRHKAMSDGRLNKCKECVKSYVRGNRSKYDLTEKGVIRVIYKTQKRSNKLRGFGDMGYSKEWLKSWVYENGFKEIFDNWVDSGYMKNSKPSVDRIDDLIGYEKNNIKLTTWVKNLKKAHLERGLGVGTQGSLCKQLFAKNAKGEDLAVFASYSSASRFMGYSLEYQIKTGKPCRNGFYWSYQ